MLIYLMAKARKSWKRIGQTVRDLVSVSEREIRKAGRPLLLLYPLA